MVYNGIERRKNEDQFCPQHISFVTDFAVIKTSLLNIEVILKEAASFKTGIITSLMGILIVLIVQISTFSFLYGKLINQVEVNTKRLSIIESKIIGSLK